MLDKINVLKICKDHVGTLRDFDTKKFSIGDLALFFVVPLVIGVVATFVHGSMGSTEVTVLVTAFSIFTALLFNLLLLTFDLISKTDDSSDEFMVKLKMLLLQQTYNNISFSILVAIAAIGLLLIYLLDSRLSFSMSQIEYIISFGVYYLTTLFLLTLLMILKRVHALLSREMKIIQTENSTRTPSESNDAD